MGAGRGERIGKVVIGRAGHRVSAEGEAEGRGVGGGYFGAVGEDQGQREARVADHGIDGVFPCGSGVHGEVCEDGCAGGNGDGFHGGRGQSRCARGLADLRRQDGHGDEKDGPDTGEQRKPRGREPHDGTSITDVDYFRPGLFAAGGRLAGSAAATLHTRIFFLPSTDNGTT